MLSKLLKMLENQLSQIYRYILTMQQDTSKKCYKLPKKIQYICCDFKLSMNVKFLGIVMENIAVHK